MADPTQALAERIARRLVSRYWSCDVTDWDLEPEIEVIAAELRPVVEDVIALDLIVSQVSTMDHARDCPAIEINDPCCECGNTPARTSPVTPRSLRALSLAAGATPMPTNDPTQALAERIARRCEDAAPLLLRNLDSLAAELRPVVEALEEIRDDEGDTPWCCDEPLHHPNSFKEIPDGWRCAACGSNWWDIYEGIASMPHEERASAIAARALSLAAGETETEETK